MPEKPVIIWFRNDLRLSDHPAVQGAVRRRAAVIPVYVLADHEEGQWPLGGASRWWLHHSLEALAASLSKRSSRLILRSGDSLSELRGLAVETNAASVLFSRRYEPHAAARDEAIARKLGEDGLEVVAFSGSLLFEPWQITRSGAPYQVFTAYWRACAAQPPPLDPSPAPDRLPRPRSWPRSLRLEELGLLPKVDWAGGLREAWAPGEQGAGERLGRFQESGLPDYAERRDRPDLDGTSRLSPHLHFGEISPRQVWHAVTARTGAFRSASQKDSASKFLAEIGWREFAHHLLHYFPETPQAPLRREFEQFPWDERAGMLAAWQEGNTGYPLVDAAMRQLWATGWMHNRLRMVVASFLVKHLLIPWQRGAGWFWDTLVDADLANNTLNWQWTAGCGADAAPFFRIFNPMTQGKRYDPDGTFVRRWVPELAKLPATAIHAPWEASDQVLTDAEVRLGDTYPAPVVDHKEARAAALAAFDVVKRTASR